MDNSALSQIQPYLDLGTMGLLIIAISLMGRYILKKDKKIDKKDEQIQETNGKVLDIVERNIEVQQDLKGTIEESKRESIETRKAMETLTSRIFDAITNDKI